MIQCPDCGAENIEGVEECEQCGATLTDLYIYEPATDVEKGLLNDTIAVLDPKSVVTVPASTPVGEVLKLLVAKEIGCVPVVQDEKVVGVFSERDALLRLNTRYQELADHPVSEFMTSKVSGLTESDSIAFAVQRMDLGSFRHIPVLDEKDGDRGIISVRDILRYLTQLMGAE